MNFVDFGAGRQAGGLDEPFDEFALSEHELQAAAKQLPLRIQELLRAMGLQENLIGGIKPELERLFRIGDVL